MNLKYKSLITALLVNACSCLAQEKYGAHIPWLTYEAEQMKTTGTILGPKYEPYQVETESSGQRCVKLGTNGQYVEFTAHANANSMVIRYSVPDNEDGNGRTAILSIYKNGKPVEDYPVSSRYSWLYGKYPFVNNPVAASPRNFYNDLRTLGLPIVKGDVIRVQLNNDKAHNAGYCIIDLVDLENVAPPITAPANSLSVTDKSFQGDQAPDDYTETFRRCFARAAATGKSVWIPAGTYKITGDIVLPANIKVQGAGMWYTTLVGDEAQYANANKRVRLKGNGSNIHLSDFAIVGKLNYRSDREANDGIVGSYGTNSTISNLWIEHTKVGMWIENSSNLRISGCRMRNTLADGINFCVGMSRSTIENCTARGTGDDCFAIWPAVFEQQQFSPGHNLIKHCTGQLPFLANGAAIYGGESNKIQFCSFSDISQGSAILMSTTFPTENKEKKINNNFSGTTVVSDCDIKTSGGFDHEWDWRAAVEIGIDKRSISGIEIRNLTITNSLSNGLSVIAKNGSEGKVFLTNTLLQNVSIRKYGIAVKGKYSLFISAPANGSLTIENSAITGIYNDSKSFTVVK